MYLKLQVCSRLIGNNKYQILIGQEKECGFFLDTKRRQSAKEVLFRAHPSFCRIDEDWFESMPVF